MPPQILRLAYIFEFLLALVTVLVFWSEVGGQGHLDLMPWYAKFALSVGLALTAVMATMAAVSNERAWNRKSVLWVAAAAFILCGMAAITYYYHLHENDDQDQEEDSPDPVACVTSVTSVPS